MAKVTIDGQAHTLRVSHVNNNNYGVAVLGNTDVPLSTVTLASRPAALHRFKVHAKSAEAAFAKGLELLSAKGLISGYTLEEGDPAIDEAPSDAADASAAASDEAAGDAEEA